MLSKKIVCSCNPWMSNGWGVVVLTNDALLFHRYCGNDFMIPFPPFSLNLDKIVGVYPRFQNLLILWQKGLQGSDEQVFWKYCNIFIIMVSLIIVGAL